MSEKQDSGHQEDSDDIASMDSSDLSFLMEDDIESKRLERLKQQEEKIKRQIAAEASELKNRKRKLETRRKIILGGVMMNLLREDSNHSKWLLQKIEEQVTREADRKTLGLSSK